jgi:hypothetical protein
MTATSKRVEQIYNEILKYPEDQHADLIAKAEIKFPGIADQINLYKSVEELGKESLLRDFGTGVAVTPEDVAALRTDIVATTQKIAWFDLTSIDEHLSVIESMSGLDMETGDYDSVFEFLKESERTFNARIKDEDSRRRKLLTNEFYSSYNAVWPKKYPRNVPIISGTVPLRQPQNIDPDLESLYDLNQFLQKQEEYYKGYFKSPYAQDLYEGE